MSKGKAQRSLELKYRLRFRLLDLASSAIALIIPWCALVVIAYMGYSATLALAGKHTLADIGLKVLADVKISEGVAYLFGLAGMAYGLSREKLRRDTTQRLATRIQELERQLDPARSSSRLTPRGTTRPEDKT